MRGRMRVGSGHMSVRKACVAAQFLRPSQRCAAGFGERLCTHAQQEALGIVQAEMIHTHSYNLEFIEMLMQKYSFLTRL